MKKFREMKSGKGMEFRDEPAPRAPSSLNKFNILPEIKRNKTPEDDGGKIFYSS